MQPLYRRCRRRSSAALWALTLTATAHAADFDAFLRGVAAEAAERGVPATVIEAAFRDLAPDPRVVRLDRRQPESVQTLDAYLAARVTPAVVAEGRAALAAHAASARRAARETGVAAAVLVAIWGIESRYGRHTGRYGVVRSLATLAFDDRRPAFFRRELLAALELAHAERRSPAALEGSWAGAMGQPQFMPSTYLRHAADGDGDGARDIWQSPADVLASIAALLAAAGWQPGLAWGAELAAGTVFAVRDPATDGGCRARRAHGPPVPAKSLREMGLDLDVAPDTPVTIWRADRRADGRADGRVFAATANFHALLEYNCANSYALAVALLADRISGARAPD